MIHNVYEELIKKTEDGYYVPLYLLPPSLRINKKVECIDNKEYIYYNQEEFKSFPGDIFDPNLLDTYDYPGSKKPYSHQIYTARFLAKHKKCFVFNAQGTGKTLSALWAMDALLKADLIKHVLVVTTKSGLKSTWLKEILENFPHYKNDVKVPQGTVIKKAEVIATKPKIILLNTDSVTAILLRDKSRLSYIDMIIYDEATALKHMDTKRHKQFATFYKGQNCRLWLMTGTPLAQSPVDAFSLAKFVSPHLLPTSFTLWKALTLYQIDKFNWQPKPTAMQTCAKVLQPSIRFELDDCIEIPPHTFIDINVEMSVKQANLFKDMATKFLIETEDNHKITVTNGGAKYNKLLQILGGVVYGEDKWPLLASADIREEALINLIEEHEHSSIVIFASFKHIQIHLFKLLNKHFGMGSVDIINGEVSVEKRTLLIEQFQNKKLRILLAHPQTLSHSVTLTASNVMIWYTLTDKNELYLQAIDRIRRISTLDHDHKRLLIYHICCSSFETEIYKHLRDKMQNQESFFEIIRTTLKNIIDTTP